MNLEEKVISTDSIYQGVIIDVERQTVELPNGESAFREVVHHSGAVGVLTITDDNKIVLVRQWRAPIAKETLEIPAGKLDDRDHADKAHAVIRELNEEVRVKPGYLEEITHFYSSVGFSDEEMTLYVASDLESVTDELPRDDGEFLNLETYTLDEAKALIKRGEIEDAKTIMAIWYFELMQK
ncbi:ADP-ribose pyrophosphatase [Secundilactobacillus oryzae JCM 18671]|uniref:ADP-ribose pyrophosphatase n=1 Tax=Secundilactobacillus oryzae JCM 18671 TaxID=1291743 RepID=A0A081BGM7_9LACO|nr:NUDIX hydrolase [Secundilactobacillus oryzae]GAK47195.1 ADP-ribose pyrophosphatase [Secundilactobacillus oryzae JCM 18671]